VNAARIAAIGLAAGLRAVLGAGPALAEPAPATSAAASMDIFEGTLAAMRWQEVRAAAEADAIVLFPIAVVEEHGPHLDLSIDIRLTYRASVLIRDELAGLGLRAVVAPPYYWGMNVSTGAFPGSFTVSEGTFKAALADSVGCLKRWGFTKVFYVNLHGDPTHRRVLNRSASELSKSLGIGVYDLADLDTPPGAEPPGIGRRPGAYSPDYHAGANETAMVYAEYPRLVDLALARSLKPEGGFQPLGYAGDPAGFEAVDIAPYLESAPRFSALQIEACLKGARAPARP
jgi:creatinine amidohydrolase